MSAYQKQESPIIKDRFGKTIALLPNPKGYYSYYINSTPERIEKLLIKKEDKFFYYHIGFNPISITRAGLNRLGVGKRKASSTITQQLVKNLLEKELERNLKNKVVELFYSVSLEVFHNKKEILNMYLNSIYLGQQRQGIYEASQLYFNLSPELLTDGQILQLLASISSPSKNNPSQTKNQASAINMSNKVGINKEDLITIEAQQVRKNILLNRDIEKTYFEISSFVNNPSKKCQTTIDQSLTEKIRKISKKNIDNLKFNDANNAAVIVIKLPENEILALVGSPDPSSSNNGYKINMLNEPRAIGSTIKPFIYLNAFERDLRPYTLIDDREYKYITAVDLPLYPQNYDFKYHGIVNLHYALSNSLNVPAVKVLEYVGLDNFYQFLEKKLEFTPIQNFKNYQLGIALGGLEMNLFDLAKYFTIFPNNGFLRKITLFYTNENQIKNPSIEKQISDPKYIQLINKILSDRTTGIEQFGMKSQLNLFQKNYAVKTGTSRDFRDSWVIGYTPDFLVGAWVGNADNSPTEKISGQIGAGIIWQETMELMLNSQYNKKTPFVFDNIKEFTQNGTIEYGLSDDDYEKQKNILLQKDTSIILLPHSGDMFLLEKNTDIILKARENVKWFINQKFLDQDKQIVFSPNKIGKYQIQAQAVNNLKEEITIFVTD
jgi:penicillin-binding protein 1C